MQIRRLQEKFEREEQHRVTRTVERLQASMRGHENLSIRGVAPKGKATSTPQAALTKAQRTNQNQRRKRAVTRPRNQPTDIHWQGTCTLQLFAKPFTSLYQATERVETTKCDFNKFKPLPDVPKTDTTTIQVIEPDDTDVPPNSSCDLIAEGLSTDVNRGLTVPKIMVRAATPSTCSESGGSDLSSLVQCAYKYRNGKRELTQLIRDIEAISKDIER